jgi:hypothetical protein
LDVGLIPSHTITIRSKDIKNNEASVPTIEISDDVSVDIAAERELAIFF